MSEDSKTPEENVFVSYVIQSGWMPPAGSSGHRKFIEKLKKKKPKELDSVIKALKYFIEGDNTVNWMINEAFRQNGIILNSPETLNNEYQTGITIPEISDLKTLLELFNQIMDEIPQFADGDLVGLPFSAVTVGIDPTLEGAAVLRLPEFNNFMKMILDKWNDFLASPDSVSDGKFVDAGWLTPKAKSSYDFPIWQQDTPGVSPYWTSWNSFFTRQFKDKNKSRPIADPNSNQVVVSASDSSLFRWDKLISKDNTYWFKDMPYSLAEILSSSDKDQQNTIEQYDLVKMFDKGYIFQTYLNPYNFHRWWSPVNGKLLFDPIVIPGYYFAKLILPDYGGATTESLPYLAQVNARGLAVIETEDYGNVAFIPLGMSEVSTVSFDPNLKKGSQVKKGDEMGMFNYGGSSFALIFQDLPDKKLEFKFKPATAVDGIAEIPYPMNPQGASSSAGSGNYPANIGSQIGVWVDK